MIINKKEKTLLCFINNKEFKGYKKNLDWMYKSNNRNYKIIPRSYDGNMNLIIPNCQEKIYFMYNL